MTSSTRILIAANAVLLAALVWFTAGPRGWAHRRLAVTWERLRADAVATERLPTLIANGVSLGVTRTPPSGTLVVFTDYECPECRQADRVLDSVRAQHPGLQVILRYYPMISNPFAGLAAAGALCAAERGRLADMHHYLMTSAAWMTLTGTTEALAARVGGTSQEWATCTESAAIRERLARDVEDARGIVVEGLPTVVGPGGRIAGAVTGADLLRISTP